MNQLRCLVLNGADYFRMAMPRGANGDARVAVKKNVAVNVSHPNALRVIGDQFESRSGIRRRNVLSVGIDYGLPLWAWQGSDYLGTSRSLIVCRLSSSLRRRHSCRHVSVSWLDRSSLGAVEKTEAEQNSGREFIIAKRCVD
jgi:hypothetical protein